MIYFPKTQREDLQELLDQEEKKANGSYRLEEVIEQMSLDFHRKCYLCEDSEPTGIQMEHFQLHKGDIALRFSWNNLFFSCSHCNGIKSDGYFPLLDCTQDERIWEQVEIAVQRFPKFRLEVKSNPFAGQEKSCENTIKLLRRIFESNTPLQKRQAENLRRKILRDDVNLIDAISRNDEERVLAMIQASANFAGMHRRTLCREYSRLWERVSFSTTE
ncbi:conserved hypothetical protein [Gammaproteobacteria bacterium]